MSPLLLSTPLIASLSNHHMRTSDVRGKKQTERSDPLASNSQTRDAIVPCATIARE